MAQVVRTPDIVHRSDQRAERAERARVWPINVNKGLLLVRLVIGLLFVGHGSQKLFGWFGGPGMQAWIDSLAKNGLEPAAFWAYMEASAELASGLCLALGMLTPLVAAILIGDMLVAIFEVHATKGLWSQNGGFEYNLVLIAILASIGFMGPGLYSLDRRLPTLPRPYAFLGALFVTLVFVALAVLPQHLAVR